jgi:hypothetical protein
VAGGDRDDEQRAPVPWHNRPSALLGASVAALVVIAILVASVSWLTSRSDRPQQAPLDFVEPSFSATTTQPATPTTTATITSTSPPATTDIDPGSTTPSSTSGSPAPTSLTPPTSPPTTYSPRTREDNGEDDSTPTSTRRRPRLNQTRTLYPLP